LRLSKETWVGGRKVVAGWEFYVPAKKINKKQMEKTLVCKSCGYLGKAKTVTKGNLGIEIVLWMFFIFPGIIYSIWRLSSKRKACPKCGSTELIPYDSPIAKKTITDAGISEEKINEAKEIDRQNLEIKKKMTKIALISAGVMFGVVFISKTISNITHTKIDDQPQETTSQEIEHQENLQSDFRLGTYKVESEELAYISPKIVNIWKSYSDRALVGKLNEGDIVEVTDYDSENDYCQVNSKGITGWVACGWLQKISP